MVTMQMGNEYATKFGKVQMTLPHLGLCPFRTIKHQQSLPYLHQLRRGIMTKGWECTPTP